MHSQRHDTSALQDFIGEVQFPVQLGLSQYMIGKSLGNDLPGHLLHHLVTQNPSMRFMTLKEHFVIYRALYCLKSVKTVNRLKTPLHIIMFFALILSIIFEYQDVRYLLHNTQTCMYHNQCALVPWLGPPLVSQPPAVWRAMLDAPVDFSHPDVARMCFSVLVEV